MKKIFCFVAILLAFTFSTKAQTSAETDAAIAFNDYCVGITQDLFVAGEKWGKVYAEVSESNEFSKLKVERAALEAIVNKYIVELTKKQVPPAYEKMKKTFLDFLVYEDNLIKKAFIPFEKFDKNSTDEAIEAAINNLLETSKDEEAYLESINVVQRAFAKQFNFILE